jgi:hypothetical protein
MFSQPSVWEKGLGSRAAGMKKKEAINKFFVSQM